MTLLPSLFPTGVPFRDGHEADIMFVHCSDFRFVEAHQVFMNRGGLPVLATKDLIAVPGSIGLYLRKAPIPGRDAPVALLIEKHHPKLVVICGHQDCAYYNGDDEAVKRDLIQAKVELGREYPELEIAIYFAKVDNLLINFERLDP